MEEKQNKTKTGNNKLMKTTNNTYKKLIYITQNIKTSIMSSKPYTDPYISHQSTIIKWN
jgi:hypothetical protein